MSRLRICQSCGAVIDDRWAHTCSFPVGNTLRYFARLLQRQETRAHVDMPPCEADCILV